MPFSKTQVLAGLQCPKALWLRAHRPELMQEAESPATVTGQVVESHARATFAGAVAVTRGEAGCDPYSRTADLLRDRSVHTILEAGIRNDELAVFIDVLQRERAGWTLTEIKGATAVKDVHIDDVAVQALALEQAGVPMERFRLMHINGGFVYPGGDDYRGLFVHEDITERVVAHRPFIADQLRALRLVCAGEQPDVHIGSHCKNPYPCPFHAHCRAHDAAYPVAWLPNGAAVARRLVAAGIFDIRDIPVGALDSERQRWVRDVTIRGEASLLPGAARQLGALAWPRYYLDFECIQFAIPIWAGTRPYQQLPFQWSCHVERNGGTLEHHEFLDTGGGDPRRSFAESLLVACGDSGSIIVYNQSFEKRIINELADLFADLRDALLALNARVLDLWPVVKNNYYHPDMQGSWSIKHVLPCLVPELSYAQLGSVREGTAAQAAYLELIGSGSDEAGRVARRADLLAYCRLDTLAMVRIVQRLCGRPGRLGQEYIGRGRSGEAR
jgi:hypothetical protein